MDASAPEDGIPPSPEQLQATPKRRGAKKLPPEERARRAADRRLYRGKLSEHYRHLKVYVPRAVMKRLEGEADKRRSHPDVLAARILQILHDEDMYRAVLDD